MPINTRLKRQSAQNVSMPWRGANGVFAGAAGFTTDSRQAAAFMYSGILSQPTTPGVGKLAKLAGPGGLAGRQAGLAG